MIATTPFGTRLAAGLFFIFFAMPSSLAETATDTVGTSAGSVALEEGRLDDAIAALDRDLGALQSSEDPNLADVYALSCDLGYAHMLRGDFHSAEQNFEEALKFSIKTQDPVVRKNFRHRRPDVCAILGLSHIYMLRGEYEKAKDVTGQLSSSYNYNMFSQKYRDDIDFMAGTFMEHTRGIYGLLIAAHDTALHGFLNFLDWAETEDYKHRFLVKVTVPYSGYFISKILRREGNLEGARDLLVAMLSADEDTVKPDPALRAISTFVLNKLASEIKVGSMDTNEIEESTETLKRLAQQFPNSGYNLMLQELLE